MSWLLFVVYRHWQIKKSTMPISDDEEAAFGQNATLNPTMTSRSSTLAGSEPRRASDWKSSSSQGGHDGDGRSHGSRLEKTRPPVFAFAY
jgi:hypothetical protein